MNELELVVPNGDVEILNETLRSIRKYTSDAEARINANASAITKDNYRKEKLNAFDGEDDLLKESADKLVDIVATQTHVKELLVEIGAARNRIKSALKERQGIIRDFKKQYSIPDPKHSYVVHMDCSDKDFKKVCDLLANGECAFRWVCVDGRDAEVNAAFDGLGYNN